ncbi:MAG: hypothetical protein EO766_12455 [Hydrotalea sp. AMD]|uniref:hypothetical protein n=1 Tax=Hydrotalea TaxID=1004300 RepID=UPI00102724EB|nr:MULTISPECIES: hypothetical protein [Hydrotalea]RWZ86996.1 MAG: hypothetical protein EO766_12455 [Hydrotalea sp. AMD]
MTQPKRERFFARMLFKYHGDNKREICYIYNRQDLDDLLNIKRQEWDNSQFISVGDIVTLEGHKCKVVNINFKLEEHLYEMGHGYGINMLSPSDPTDYNCQIGVFVERLD